MLAKRIFVFIFIAILNGFFCLSVNAFYDEGIPFIRNYTPSEYGGSSLCHHLIEDYRGIIYALNDGNMLEYDGRSWKKSLDNIVYARSLAMDSRGVVYIGGISDFGFMANNSQGRLGFTSLRPKLENPQEKIDWIRKIIPDKNGVYFFSNEKFFQYQQNQVRKFPIALMGNWAFLIQDQLLLVTYQKGIQIWEKQRLKPLPFTETFTKNKDANVFLFPYSPEQLLIISDQDGLWIYEYQKALRVRVDEAGQVLKELPSEVAPFLRHHRISSAVSFFGGYILGTNSGGILAINRSGQLLWLLNDNRGLQDNIVLDLFLDHRQNLWAGLYRGISRIDVSSPLTKFDERTGLKNGSLNTVKFEGTRYVFSMGGMFWLPTYQLKMENNTFGFIRFRESNQYGYNGYILKNTLFCQYNQDLALICKGQVVQKVPGIDTVGAFVTSKRFPKVLFLGLKKNFACLFLEDPVSGSGGVRVKGVKHFSNIAVQVWSAFEDEAGDLLLNTMGQGIVHMQFTGNQVDQYKLTAYGARDGLQNNLENYIFQVGRSIKVASYEGVYDIIRQDGARLKFIRDPQYFQTKVFQILEYNNRLLVNAKGQLGFFDIKPGGQSVWDCTPFKRIPMQFLNCMIEENDILWICASDGLYRYNPQMNYQKKESFPVLIRKVMVNSESTLLDGNYFDPEFVWDSQFHPSATTQPEMLKTVLPYRKNSLIFEYAAVFLECEDQNLFSYWMQGYDRDWSAWSNLARKEYTNLPEGKYLFQVRGSNLYGTIGKTSQFEFTIRPPFYRTWIAYGCYVVLLVLLLFFASWLNSHRLIAAKEKLEKIVTERTAEVVRQKNEIEQKKGELEVAYGNLYSTNRQLVEAKNALWGEMELAKKIQTVLLPLQPRIPGYEIAAYMRPADEVGGDYYDVINIDGGKGHVTSIQHWIVIGDVSGHGVPAGLVMMMVQTSIRTALKTHGTESPKRILEIVNSIIYENIKKLGEDKYMTITLMSVQEKGAIFYSGLHQNIIIYRAQKKAVELVETQGMWIGVVDDIKGMIGVDQLILEPEDVMLLYTDGISESTDKEGKMFSEEKLAELFGSLGPNSPEAIKTSILQSLSEYRFTDDLTLMIIKRNNPASDSITAG